jgi:hypothetical protein
VAPGPGDRALADLLQFHSLAMNGGVLHGYEVLSSDDSRHQVAAAIAGYRYFGLEQAAAAVEWLVTQAAGVDLQGDLDTAERLEGEADGRYASAVPTDSTLVEAFEQRYRVEPEAFAAVN